MTAPLENTAIPLAVDLDGCLVKTDVLFEAMFSLLHVNPFYLFSLLYWYSVGGKARVKNELAVRIALDAAHLPYNEQLLARLRAEKAAGRVIVLATASPRRYAEAVAAHTGLFERVFASEGTQNLSGKNKARALTAAFGHKQYDYAGNAAVDLKVWDEARQAIVVNPERGVLARAKKIIPIAAAIETRPAFFKTLLKALRVYQWLKNGLLFAPLILSHKLFNDGLLSDGVMGFFAFGACASSVYLLNDLLDLPDDRKHRSKRNRPFAAGTLDIRLGAVLIPVLLLGSFALAVLISWHFVLVLAAYYFVTNLYSFWLKRKAIVDVLVLAGLYTIRIVAGAVIIQEWPTFWLLAFSMSLFLSLAMVKRYTELLHMSGAGEQKSGGRGYAATDAPMVMAGGLSSGLLSVLIFSLYLNSSEVLMLYKQPEALWLVAPILLYWILRVWLLAHRGQMHDDPVVFAIKDSLSRWLVVPLTLIMFIAVMYG